MERLEKAIKSQLEKGDSAKVEVDVHLDNIAVSVVPQVTLKIKKRDDGKYDVTWHYGKLGSGMYAGDLNKDEAVRACLNLAVGLDAGENYVVIDLRKCAGPGYKKTCEIKPR